MGYLTRRVYSSNINNLAELTPAIHEHVRTIPSDVLRATVENVVMRFNF